MNGALNVEEIVVKISRLRIYFVLGFCVSGWVTSRLLLGSEHAFNVLPQGGVNGIIAVGNYVFSAGVIGVALMIMGMPTELKIDGNGLVESGPLGSFSCRWNEVVDLERVNTLGGSVVLVDTKTSEHLLSAYYTMDTNQLLDLFNRYRTTKQTSEDSF